MSLAFTSQLGRVGFEICTEPSKPARCNSGHTLSNPSGHRLLNRNPIILAVISKAERGKYDRVFKALLPNGSCLTCGSKRTMRLLYHRVIEVYGNAIRRLKRKSKEWIRWRKKCTTHKRRKNQEIPEKLNNIC